MNLQNTIYDFMLQKLPIVKEEDSEFYLDIKQTRENLYKLLNEEEKRALDTLLFHLFEYYEERERVRGSYTLSLGIRMGKELQMWNNEWDKIF